MEDDYRIAKFKMLIQKVNKLMSHGSYGYANYVSEGLRLIFDFQIMNRYAQLIKDCYSYCYYNYDMNSIDAKIAMITEISKLLKTYDYGRPFLFWALMVLAVDDTNKEKHLSLICDFARMLEVTDDEMKDLVNVIKRIFKCGDYEPIKTHKVKIMFYDSFWDKF